MATTFTNGLYKDGGARLTNGTAGVFVPEVWSAQLLTDTEDQLVLGNLFGTSTYEGEFKREGDVIRIPHFRDTVVDKGVVPAYGSIGTADKAELEYIKMQVAKGSSFHFEVDSLHQLQTKQGVDLMSELVRQRARKTALALDALVATAIVQGSIETAAASGLGKDANSDGGTAALHGLVESVALGTGATARYNQIVDMLALLDDANSEGERFLVIGTSVRSEILKMKEFIDASHWGGTPIMVNGFVGSVLGVPVVVSNTVGARVARKGKQALFGQTHTAATSVDMILGTRGSVAAVIPNIDMDTYKPEAKFTDAVKARVHYDAKVIAPAEIVVGTPATP
ncbi:phage major capsid protein, HK97 family [Streptosporangium canum]|uniref:Phage major capsid protein, HK97 family n=1 Tax=Streptosporangium canum TaxID=324952 RepID=A0A1I3LBW5_9ACTN|nr:phage major capsid protein [Streptosporangium canum]SFI81986.1 phage major capsid protein, HK97 family [Streptosporangium canum]